MRVRGNVAVGRLGRDEGVNGLRIDIANRDGSSMRRFTGFFLFCLRYPRRRRSRQALDEY